jgi:hypothetical protein
MSSDAIVDVAFENNGGSVMLDMVLINGIQVNVSSYCNIHHRIFTFSIGT